MYISSSIIIFVLCVCTRLTNACNPTYTTTLASKNWAVFLQIKMWTKVCFLSNNFVLTIICYLLFLEGFSPHLYCCSKLKPLLIIPCVQHVLSLANTEGDFVVDRYVWPESRYLDQNPFLSWMLWEQVLFWSLFSWALLLLYL